MIQLIQKWLKKKEELIPVWHLTSPDLGITLLRVSVTGRLEKMDTLNAGSEVEHGRRSLVTRCGGVFNSPHSYWKRWIWVSSEYQSQDPLGTISSRHPVWQMGWVFPGFFRHVQRQASCYFCILANGNTWNSWFPMADNASWDDDHYTPMNSRFEEVIVSAWSLQLCNNSVGVDVDLSRYLLMSAMFSSVDVATFCKQMMMMMMMMVMMTMMMMMMMMMMIMMMMMMMTTYNSYQFLL